MRSQRVAMARCSGGSLLQQARRSFPPPEDFAPAAPGLCSFATRSAWGRPVSAAKLGRPLNGCERGGEAQDHAHGPVGHLRRQALAPASRAAWTPPIRPWHPLRVGIAAGQEEPERPAGVLADRSSSTRTRPLRPRSRSACRRRRARRLLKAWPMPISSSGLGVAGRAPARRWVVRWDSVRLVVKPNAPAFKALLRQTRASFAMSSGLVASSKSMARSPIT